ncbi:small conductance mechanosensitive channel [Fusobacterium sp. PH5-7]|uniref:mechanosensitive ion channel family protein n=1 Tax=Fusobacterium sp. PH5-7 TaxID=2940528 RepID=UPI002474B16E|nr:mechanosensitive ion channel domain-containing protein [Fusobacterium sp. PH5-7]MDH6458708.1 small conductance mechanosensitive channel [Fusobacterium sp. PH5-7]
MQSNIENLMKKWGEDLIRVLPGTILRIIWIIFLIIIMKHVVNIIIQALKLLMEKSHVDELLSSFILSLTKTIIYIGFFFLVIGGLGVKATSLITLLGTAGLAVGLALQGSLSNLAGGVLILFFKPFLKGEYIKSNSGEGTVESIHILYTILTTLDNSRIIIPNSQLANAAIINISRNDERRVDLTVSVAYGTQEEKVKKILTEIAEEDSNILHDKGYTIRMNKHNSSSLDYVYRVWTKKENYWEVYFSLTEKVAKYFERERIEIPYQKIDIYNKAK